MVGLIARRARDCVVFKQKTIHATMPPRNDEILMFFKSLRSAFFNTGVELAIPPHVFFPPEVDEACDEEQNAPFPQTWLYVRYCQRISELERVSIPAQNTLELPEGS